MTWVRRNDAGRTNKKGEANMTQSKQISRSNWPDFCVTFSNGNRGRPVAIEVLGEEEEDCRVVDSAPLFGIA